MDPRIGYTCAKAMPWKKVISSTNDAETIEYSYKRMNLNIYITFMAGENAK